MNRLIRLRWVERMAFIELTTSTAPAARRCIRSFTAPPLAHLSPSRSAAALASLQQQEHVRIDATTSRITTHLEDVACFASEVERLDTSLSRRLAP